MENYVRIKVAVAIRIGPVPDKHGDLAVKAIGGRSKECVIGNAQRCACLNVRNDAVIAQAASPKIVLLIISCRFGETELIKPIMIPIDPIEHLHGSGIGVIVGGLRQIEGEIENAIWIAHRPALGGVGRSVKVPIHKSISVIPGGGVCAVGNPAIRRGSGIEGWGSDEHSVDQRWLKGDWGWG